MRNPVGVRDENQRAQSLRDREAYLVSCRLLLGELRLARGLLSGLFLFLSLLCSFLELVLGWLLRRTFLGPDRRTSKFDGCFMMKSCTYNAEASSAGGCFWSSVSAMIVTLRAGFSMQGYDLGKLGEDSDPQQRVSSRLILSTKLSV